MKSFTRNYLPRLGKAARPRVSHKNRLLGLIVMGAAASTGTLMATAPHHDPTVVAEKSWPVTTVRAQATELAPQLQLFGRVETPHHASLSSAIDAQVLELHVSEGESVRRGQVLLSLDPAQERLRLAQQAAQLQLQQAQLESLQRDFASERAVLTHLEDLFKLTRSKTQRLQSMVKRQLIATEQMENTQQEVARQGIDLARQQALVANQPNRLEQARANVASAQARYDDQQLQLERASIRAPFDGRISGLLAAPGDRVQPGQALLQMYDSGAMQVRVALPANVIPDLEQALAAGVSIHARSEQAGSDLQLHQLAAAVKSGSSGIEGIFIPTADSGSLTLGGAVELRLSLPGAGAVIALPQQSLYDNKRIYVVENQRLRSIEVEPLGQYFNDDGTMNVLIAQTAVAAGAEILATNLPRAMSGLKVQVVNGGVASGNPAGILPVPG